MNTIPTAPTPISIPRAVFSREGTRLPVNGDESVLIADSPGDDWYPLLLRGPAEARLY